MVKGAVLFLICWNLFVFFTYGVDKRRAVKGKWRIRERTLLLMAFLLGGAGAAAGMKLFHHKTEKKKFRICIPLAIAVNLFFFAVALYYFDV